jgi:hypothetical protein
MKSQFRVLVDFFFDRFFDSGGRTNGQDEKFGLAYRLALLAMPSLFLMWAPTRTPGVRYLFVCYTMVVTGAAMIHKWDVLFPDHLDYQILTSLPVSVRRLFAARIVALGRFLSMYVIAVNAVPLIMVQFLSAARYAVFPGWGVIGREFVGHAAATIGGSLFMVLFFVALHGVLINVLTPGAFRRSSVGIGIASSSLFVAGSNRDLILSDIGMLEAPRILAAFLLLGTRIAFTVPHEIGASWVFEMTRASREDVVRAIRKWVIVFRIFPLFAIVAAFEFALFEPARAIEHLIFNITISGLLAALCFFDFRKVPFTVTPKTLKLDLVVFLPLACAAAVTFMAIATRLQENVILGFWSLGVFVILVGGIVAGLMIWSDRNPNAVLVDRVFDEEFQELGLLQ